MTTPHRLLMSTWNVITKFINAQDDWMTWSNTAPLRKNIRNVWLPFSLSNDYFILFYFIYFFFFLLFFPYGLLSVKKNLFQAGTRVVNSNHEGALKLHMTVITKSQKRISHIIQRFNILKTRIFERYFFDCFLIYLGISFLIKEHIRFYVHSPHRGIVLPLRLNQKCLQIWS